MTRVVGTQNRSDVEFDPVRALERGRRLDAMLRAASPARPHGVQRANHRVLNQLDDERQLQIARRLNAATP